MIVHDVIQGENDWFTLRAGIPTASNAKSIITGTGKPSTSITDYAMTLAAEMYAGKSLDGFEGNQHTERGNDLEADARIAYELSTGTWIEQCGFVTVDDGSFGASPDGLLDDGMIEIKCLMAKNHVKNMVYYKKHKRVMPDYVPQTQMGMLVCEKAWCDVVFYHPDLPLLIIRQDPIPEFHEMLKKQLAECIKLRDESLKCLRELG